MEEEEAGSVAAALSKDPMTAANGTVGEASKKEKSENNGGAVRNEATEEEDDEDDEEEAAAAVASEGFVPGPLLSLKQHLEKDKEDDSLRRWKEKLLGCIDGDLNDQMLPEVKFHSIGIISENNAEINTPLPIGENQSKLLFSLREGSQYHLKLSFTVQHNIVSGLRYSNTVWKGGLQVDQSKGMLGTFAPQRDSYVHILEEETTPSGVLARGIYSAKLTFEDDDRRCHMELDYSFEIKKRS